MKIYLKFSWKKNRQILQDTTEVVTSKRFWHKMVVQNILKCIKLNTNRTSKTNIIQAAPVRQTPIANIHLHGSEIQKYLLQLGLRHHIILNVVLELIILNDRENRRQRNVLTVSDVHVDESVPVFFELGVLERHVYKVNEPFYSRFAALLVCWRATYFG